MKNYKHWSDFEKYRLWLGHKMEVPLKVLEGCLGRSISSINKAQSRLNIRTEDLRISMYRIRRRRHALAKIAYIKGLKLCCLTDEHREVFENVKMRQRFYYENPEVQKKFAEFGIDKTPPWQKIYHQHQERSKRYGDRGIMVARIDSPKAVLKLGSRPIYSDAEKDALKNLRLDVTLDAVLAFMQRQGHNITMAPTPYANDLKYPTYLVNGQIMTAGILVYETNKLRKQMNLPVYIVRGLSEE